MMCQPQARQRINIDRGQWAFPDLTSDFFILFLEGPKDSTVTMPNNNYTARCEPHRLEDGGKCVLCTPMSGTQVIRTRTPCRTSYPLKTHISIGLVFWDVAVPFKGSIPSISGILPRHLHCGCVIVFGYLRRSKFAWGCSRGGREGDAR